MSATAEAFKAWLIAFRPQAISRGIDSALYDRVSAGLVPDFGLPDLDIPAERAGRSRAEQAEFIKTPAQYLNGKYLAELAAQGRVLRALHAKTLAAIEKAYGVDPNLLLGLWGRETAFGTYKLPHLALPVLATEAYAGRRRDKFQEEFIGALRMVQQHVIEPKDMHSSWAGAMGLVQFLPSDYWNYAVDEDGDGKADIWTSVPDALASLANNLKKIGWEPGQPWGLEVNVPENVDCSLGDLDIRKPVAEWARMGIVPFRGAFPERLLSVEASLLQPAGIFGPGFLTFQNFQVIREYNKSDLYALFVGNLADRISGGGGFSRPWRPVVQVSSADVTELQGRLARAGLYQDTVDGKAGGRTRSALGLYQKREGLPETCWPTAELIVHARKNLPAPAKAPGT